MTTQQHVAPWRLWTMLIASVVLWIAFVAQSIGESDRGWSVWLMLVAAVLMTFSTVSMFLKR